MKSNATVHGSETKPIPQFHTWILSLTNATKTLVTVIFIHPFLHFLNYKWKSFFTASKGYAVYKSIPYGTVEEVLPYLARRVIENKSVLEGARKEKTLLNKELWHRIGGKFSFRTSRSSENARSNS